MLLTRLAKPIFCGLASKGVSLNISATFSLRSSLVFSLVCASAILILVSGAAKAAQSGEEPYLVRAQSGIANRWKVGFLTWHRIEIQGRVEQQNRAENAKQQQDGASAGSGAGSLAGMIAIETVDGDGNPVIYSDPAWKFQLDEKVPGVVDVYAKHGRSDRPIRILVQTLDGQTLQTLTLDEEQRGEPLPPTQPWVVGIGSERLDLEQGALRSAQGALGEYSVSEVTQAVGLPREARGYDGVDSVVLSSSNSQVNQEIDLEQREALTRWISRGGQVVLSWGAGGAQLAGYEEFAKMLPGRFGGTVKECEPSPIESLLGSQKRLEPLECSVLKMTSGKMEVMGVTKSRVKLPLISRWSYGLGSVTWLATEIDGPELTGWETRPSLVKYLLKDHWDKWETRGGRTSFLGYDDMSGQLNTMLDTFPSLTLGGLGHLVVIVSLFALLIGPVDYFLVARLWKRPRWTWWTLLATSLFTMVGSSLLARAWKPSTPTVNSIELIDVNDQTQELVGRGYAHVYGGRRGLFDFNVFHRSLSDATSQGSAMQASRLDWFSQPGKGLGGFESNVTSALGLPKYWIRAVGEGSFIGGIGIPEAGTKGLSYEWTQPLAISKDLNGLTTVAGKDDLLQGSFANPLNVDLLDGTLYFAGRAYAIPDRIRPGERIPITAMIPKDITRRLQRRTFVAGQEQGVEWDPSNTLEWERLAELMTFHRASGGAAYTGLHHRYLSMLENSDLLKLDKAVVFGRLPEPVSSWNLQRDGVQRNAVGGKQLSVVRLVLVVENKDRSLVLLKDQSASPGPNP